MLDFLFAYAMLYKREILRSVGIVKKAAVWPAIRFMAVFLIAFCILSVQLLNGEYGITVAAYVCLISFAVYLISILYMKFST